MKLSLFFSPQSLASLFFMTSLLSCGLNVEHSTLSGVVPFDGDGDGVGPLEDRCPVSDLANDGPIGSSGCGSKDGDSDGVPDFYDNCPNTPSGAQVNKWDGCMTKSAQGTINLAYIGPDGIKYTTPYYVNGSETTDEAIKKSLMELVKDFILGAGEFLEDPTVEWFDIPGADSNPCAQFPCNNPSPSQGGSLGGSGGYNSPGTGPASAPAGTPTPTPSSGAEGSTGLEIEPVKALPPIVISGASLTATVDPEQLGVDLANFSYLTTVDNPSAGKLVALTKSQNAVASNMTENLRAPQAAMVTSLFNQNSLNSLHIADELLTAGKTPEAEAYMYLASALTDATYDIANTDVVTKLGGNEEVPALYRNIYEAISGQNIMGPEPISDEARAKALLAVVNSQIGKKMLQPGTQAQQVASFGILFKRIMMSYSADESSIDALIKAAQTI